MRKNITKTVYLKAEDETMKEATERDKKIKKHAKALKTTEAGAVRAMIDYYPN